MKGRKRGKREEEVEKGRGEKEKKTGTKNRGMVGKKREMGSK